MLKITIVFSKEIPGFSRIHGWILQEWNGITPLNYMEFHQVPIWVQMCELPIYAKSPQIGLQLGELGEVCE